MRDYEYNVLLTDQITGGVEQSQVLAVSINITFKSRLCDDNKALHYKQLVEVDLIVKKSMNRKPQTRNQYNC